MGFLKVCGWAVGRTLNKEPEGKKIEIFQSLGMGDNAGMGCSAVKYSIYAFTQQDVFRDVS